MGSVALAEQFNKTLLYDGLDGLPSLVEDAVALARKMAFPFSCVPDQGRLLHLLAGGRDGGRIAETGTGCGVGLAWMTSAVGAATQLISIEADAKRAKACQQIFARFANVTVLHGDWREIIAHGPFDLLVLDGGGAGKREDDPPANPTELLKPGGTVELDDFHPPVERWPPTERSAADGYGRNLDRARDYWFNHPDLLTTEFRVHPRVSAVVGMRRGNA